MKPRNIIQRNSLISTFIFKRNTPQLAAAGIKGMRIQFRLRSAWPGSNFMRQRLGCPAACGVGALPPFHLKHLAVRNPRTWWPAVRKLLDWYKWNPQKREFIKVAFLLDQTTFRWTLRGAPTLPEVDAWIEKVDAQFEVYKQDTAFHDYTESLDPCEKRSIIEEIRNQFKAMKDQEIRLCRENMKLNPP